MSKRSKIRNRSELRSSVDFFIPGKQVLALKDSDPLAQAVWDSMITGVGIPDREMQRLLKTQKLPFDV